MHLKPYSLSLWIVFFLWMVYTFIYTMDLGGFAAALFELIPGLLGVALLTGLGYKYSDRYLQGKKLSRQGLIMLAVLCLGLLAPLIPALAEGQRASFHWLPVLVYAPASALAQELFFRSALLPVFIRCSPTKRSGILLHAVLFGLWHLPRAYLASPINPFLGAAAVSIVTFLIGMGWGWQVDRDKTIFWVLVQHTLFLMILALYGL